MFCLKKQTTIVALVCIGLSIGTVAQAQAQSPAERVRQINEDIAVLSAQLLKLELEAKIAGKEAEKQRSSGASGFANPVTDEMPVVRAIDGMDGRLVATLAMRGGVVQTVREGEKFGVWTTKAITVNSVTLARGKETVRVPFGNEPPGAGNHSGAVGSPMVGGAIQPPNFPR